VTYQIFGSDQLNDRFKVSDKHPLQTKYPWEQLTVGTFFFIPLSEMSENQRRNGYRPTAPVRLIKAGWKFETRKVYDVHNDDQPGILIQRVV
jgi:hypothetical protein